MADVKILGYTWFTGINSECIGIVVTHNGYEEKAYIGVVPGHNEESDIKLISERGGKVYPVEAAKMLCNLGAQIRGN